MPTRANQTELHTDTNQITHTNVATSATFSANDMVTSNIDNANVIIIASGNAIPKIANANRITIVYCNAIPTRSDSYMTAIKWQCNGQKSRHQYSSKPNHHG